MIEKLRNTLKDEGRSVKWFYLKYIKQQTGLSYTGLANQLNGYANLSLSVQDGILKYFKTLI